MHISRDKQHLFFTFVVFASCFFVLGLSFCYFIPFDSFIYSLLEKALINNLNKISFSLYSFLYAFLGEMKYFLFVLIALFSNYRYKFLILLVSYRAFLFGISSACLMRCVKMGSLYINYSFIYCFLFVFLIVALICTIIYACCEALLFSSKIIYPIRPKAIVKRKDTYMFLLNFAAICGVVAIVIFLIIGIIYLMIS